MIYAVLLYDTERSGLHMARASSLSRRHHLRSFLPDQPQNVCNQNSRLKLGQYGGSYCEGSHWCFIPEQWQNIQHVFVHTHQLPSVSLSMSSTCVYVCHVGSLCRTPLLTPHPARSGSTFITTHGYSSDHTHLRRSLAACQRTSRSALYTT